MARDWLVITPDEAKRHPLYGIKGSLAVFALLWIIRGISAFGQLSTLSR